jgi:hypothetical protein
MHLDLGNSARFGTHRGSIATLAITYTANARFHIGGMISSGTHTPIYTDHCAMFGEILNSPLPGHLATSLPAACGKIVHTDPDAM